MIEHDDTSGKDDAIIRHYFVDESGDGVLFNRDGEDIAGTNGCSQYFILGLLAVRDPQALERDFSELRRTLLADSYLKGISSMQPEQGKTVRAFHAKDDCPEVRLIVFRRLMQHDCKFFAVVRDKRFITQRVREHNLRNQTYRYHPDQLYDQCVSQLFHDRLHKDDGYSVHFATRGNRSRTAALKTALEQARTNFRQHHGIESSVPIEIVPAASEAYAGLQAADYFLWALQRLYERHEERYFEFVRAHVSLVYDVDDRRYKAYGEFYTKENLLSRERLKGFEPRI